jgi:hypothetical protein
MASDLVLIAHFGAALIKGEMPARHLVLALVVLL